MIINQGLHEGLISSAPRSVPKPHQYINLSSPINIYQYINTKEETVHDVASFLCTRSEVTCNNQIRCFFKNHPWCFFFSFKSIYFRVITCICHVDHSQNYSVFVAIHFFRRGRGGGGGQKRMTTCYYDCMIVCEFCYTYLHKEIFCYSSAQPLSLLYQQFVAINDKSSINESLKESGIMGSRPIIYVTLGRSVY